MNDHSYMILKALSVKKMQQKQLAKLTRISQSHLTQIISYHRTLSVNQAKEIESALGIVSARELLHAQVDWKLTEDQRNIPIPIQNILRKNLGRVPDLLELSGFTRKQFNDMKGFGNKNFFELNRIMERNGFPPYEFRFVR